MEKKDFQLTYHLTPILLQPSPENLGANPTNSRALTRRQVKLQS
ncbi:hypothetical protein CCACVL1_11245 [Corchorus capsularis]|uniref:Uncharacterized protein n=1 Tax=Corchorus capsularis TaxID=210143 RepID=A0A1R3IMB9_COCAP|nr:hypothetical protein CCACVL1_11245 [Corchorus capsularis]